MTCKPTFPSFREVTCGFIRFVVQGQSRGEALSEVLGVTLQDTKTQTGLGYTYVSSLHDYLAHRNVSPNAIFFRIFPDYHLIDVPLNKVFPVIASLFREFQDPRRKGQIELIEPNYALRILAPPSAKIGIKFDLAKGKSCHNSYIKLLRADQAATDSADGSGVRVAIVDTGLERGKSAVSYTDLTALPGSSAFQADNDGHGTAMTAIIQDVAPGAELHVIRITDSSEMFLWDLLAGVTTAVYNKDAHVVSLSLGCKDLGLPCNTCGVLQGSRSLVCETFFDTIASNSATGYDPIVVAATGNDGNAEEFNWPARYESVLAIGSINNSKKPSTFSNMAYPPPKPKLHTGYAMCPGGEIDGSGLVTEAVGEGDDAGNVTYCVGTSPATAYAAGVLALRRHYNLLNGYSVDRVRLLDEAQTKALQDIPNYNSGSHGMGRLVYRP